MSGPIDLDIFVKTNGPTRRQFITVFFLLRMDGESGR